MADVKRATSLDTEERGKVNFEYNHTQIYYVLNKSLETLDYIQYKNFGHVCVLPLIYCKYLKDLQISNVTYNMYISHKLGLATFSFLIMHIFAHSLLILHIGYLIVLMLSNV